MHKENGRSGICMRDVLSRPRLTVYFIYCIILYEVFHIAVRNPEHYLLLETPFSTSIVFKTLTEETQMIQGKLVSAFVLLCAVVAILMQVPSTELPDKEIVAKAWIRIWLALAVAILAVVNFIIDLLGTYKFNCAELAVRSQDDHEASRCLKILHIITVVWKILLIIQVLIGIAFLVTIFL